MKRVRSLFLALVTFVAVSLVVVTIPRLAQAATLAERIDAVAQASPVRSQSSIYVWHQSTRKVMYTKSASRDVIPASTMKLLTSAAALNRMGPSHRFSTRLLLTGRQDGSAWIGSAWLIGGGDPTLSTYGYRSRHLAGSGANIARLVDGLTSRGITSISGRIYVVDDWLDSKRYVSDWPLRFRYDEAGALGALTVNQSNLGSGNDGPSTRTPDIWAGTVLREIMGRSGIRVRGGVVAASMPTGAIEVSRVQSPTLLAITRHLNRQSDNFVAEILLKQIGRHRYGAGKGTTIDGRRAARAEIARLGVNLADLRWSDGSGLSYSNRVTSRMLGHVLGVGAQASWGDAWISTFAQSGTSGTLRRRLTTTPYRTRVRAKTGTLRMSSGLAGFADRAGSGSRYGFVVITYQAGGSVSTDAARRLQDRVAKILVR